MKCDDTTMNVELRYLTVLEQATYYKLDGTRLSLFNKQGEAPRATFEAVE
jgi:heat shock protein HslJ